MPFGCAAAPSKTQCVRARDPEMWRHFSDEIEHENLTMEPQSASVSDAIPLLARGAAPRRPQGPGIGAA